MATSRREPNPNARTNRAVRNMSPVLKPREPDQALLRRARSVPNSPDRTSSASTAASSSSTAGRPSSSVNPRATSSRSTSGSSSSAAHGKSALLSAMVGAKQAASTMRRRADNNKSGATSVWPHALTSPNPSPKDPASKAPKSSSSSAQKGKLSTRPGAEKTAAAAAASSSSKPRAQKATGAGTTQAAARGPGAAAKRKTGPETSAPSIQRTTSVPVAATKADEREMELLMEEFDEMESISTHSIEEHLQERLPDPVDFATYAASEQHARSEPPSNQEECKNGMEEIAEHKFSEEKHQDLKGGGNADTDDSEAVAAKEAVDEAESNEAAAESGLKESAGETEVNEAGGQIEMKKAADAAKLNEAELKASDETESKDPELAVKEEAKAKEDVIIPPATKTTEEAQRWKKDDGRSNEAAEEGRSKTTMQERRNRVMALVGRFETAMSGRE